MNRKIDKRNNEEVATLNKLNNTVIFKHDLSHDLHLLMILSMDIKILPSEIGFHLTFLVY